eukprot:6185571-Pleurochrysis_carterae.AAC.1
MKLPTHRRKVPHKVVDGKMTRVEKKLLYVPGKMQVKDVCATLNQTHKLQVGTKLLEANDGYCYISDGAESLRTEYLALLLFRHDADGNLKATALDLTMLQSKTLAAQAEAFKESLCETAELLRDVVITETMEPRILNFVPASTMDDRAAEAGKAARLVRGDDETVDDPTCAYYAITNIFEEGRKAREGV